MRNNYFQNYLEVSPFALALWRGMEAQTIADGYQLAVGYKLPHAKIDISFPRPILDLGCGFGEFAGVFFKSKVEVGVDINSRDLFLAAKGQKYKRLLCEDARKLSFKSNSFKTVISMSVLEHIPGTEIAISEAYRVLKKGGLLIITVPTTNLNNQLFYPWVLRKLHLFKLADWYIKKFHKVFKHESLFSPEKWYAILKNCKFKIIRKENTISPLMVKIFDLSLVFAFPSQLLRWSLGTRGIWGISFKKPILVPLFNMLKRLDKPQSGNILIIAQK